VNAELVNKAHTTSDKEKVRKHPKLARAPGAIRELRAPDATDEDDE
jgi:hypothetical protein